VEYSLVPNLEYQAQSERPRLLLSPRSIRVGFACLVTAVLAWAWFANPDARRNLVLATSRQPEHITELYFTDHTSLPKTFRPHSEQAFSFTLHNLEGRETSYTYQIHVNSQPYGPLTQVTLADGETRVITQYVAINDKSTRAEVEVSLVDPPQSIHYWTERSR
jgi:hypothetical protein